jgi:hypothetical protein
MLIQYITHIYFTGAKMAKSGIFNLKHCLVSENFLHQETATVG